MGCNQEECIWLFVRLLQALTETHFAELYADLVAA